jgi:alpha-L-rhamnosidase
VRITPHLGNLEHASATMPTPKGMVEVRYVKGANGWKATVTLPEGLPGELAWKDKSMPLKAGKQQLLLP